MNEAIIIDWIGGNCPVQAEGTIDGKEFYFRARGGHWSLSIGGENVVGEPDWYHEEPYGDEEFAAGWMTKKEARDFLEKAANLYLSRDEPPNDGQPDEQQEWHDYDQDC